MKDFNRNLPDHGAITECTIRSFWAFQQPFTEKLMDRMICEYHQLLHHLPKGCTDGTLSSTWKIRFRNPQIWPLKERNCFWKLIDGGHQKIE